MSKETDITSNIKNKKAIAYPREKILIQMPMTFAKRIMKTLFSLRYLSLTVVAIVIVLVGHFWWTKTGEKIPSSNATPAFPQSLVAGDWHPVTVGAGGYITGFYAHPLEANLLYIRTDNGGFYRWQQSLQQWQHITQSLPRGNWDYDHNSGGEALALDPQNPDTVYIAVGKYTDKPGTIYRSENRGMTWQESDLAVPMGGDQDKRWAGDRLKVSPFDSNLLLFGSRHDGLWRSQNGGIHWERVTDFPVKTENSVGVLAIAFDPNRENLVYASIYQDGVYQSSDRGITWRKLPQSPRGVMQMAVAKDGTLYTTNSESPQVSKYVDNRWLQITPRRWVHKTFNGLSLHPDDPDTLIVSEGEKGGAQIYYSANGGHSWQTKKAVIDNTVPWLADEFFSDHPSAISFDPLNPRRVWLTDWFSVWRTDNIQGKEVRWSNQVEGIEQTVVFELLSPPEGAILLSGIADQDGFYHHNLQEYPHKRFGFQRKSYLGSLDLTGNSYLDNYFQDTFDLAYCQNYPQNLVRLGGKRWSDTFIGATSSDGGQSWKPWATVPDDKLFMRVAIAPNNPRHYVVTTSEDLPLMTRDGGQTWQTTSGLPPGETGPWNWNQPLAADGAVDSLFYYYAAGKFYQSRDGGVSFQEMARDLPQARRYILTAVPGVAGEVWLSLDAGGLYHSQNGGISWQKISNVRQAYLVTIGTSVEDKLPHSVYIYGQLQDGSSGLFMSSDSGSIWQQIDPMAKLPRSIKVLSASQQMPGLIFAGTDGRGIHYRLVKSLQLNLTK